MPLTPARAAVVSDTTKDLLAPPRIKRVIIGIDPGANGAIVISIDGEAHKPTTYLLSERTDQNVWSNLEVWGAVRNRDIFNPIAFIEDIPPAIFGVNKSSCSKLYGSYRMLRAFLTAASIPFETVKAVVWQRVLGIEKRKKQETTSKWKNRLKQKAEQLFPTITVTLATSDALLIAHYGRQRVANQAILGGLP